MDKEERRTETGKPCEGFAFADAAEAYRHMQYEKVKDYGSFLYGHHLHTWDEGGRILARCRSCGGYILIQFSEYHSFSDSPDGYYTDFFPVSSPEEADELNRLYDGMDIEMNFKERYLMKTNGQVGWSKETE